MLKTVLPLVVGGSLGALARWKLSQLVDARLFPASGFPFGILVVNVLGCFFFGWLYASLEARGLLGETLRLAVFTGFLGSFTTFSTFGWNTLELLREGQAALAFGNVAASLLLGLLAVAAGFLVGR